VAPPLPADGTIVAGIVWNAKLPIHQGDRIVEINGQRCERIDFAKAVSTPPFVLSGKKTENRRQEKCGWRKGRSE